MPKMRWVSIRMKDGPDRHIQIGAKDGVRRKKRMISFGYTENGKWIEVLGAPEEQVISWDK